MVFPLVSFSFPLQPTAILATHTYRYTESKKTKKDRDARYLPLRSRQSLQPNNPLLHHPLQRRCQPFRLLVLRGSNDLEHDIEEVVREVGDSCLFRSEDVGCWSL